MQKPIKTAVFPVAGLGTRLLPATKAMPKEMLPIVDTPLIQMAIDEAKAAGIDSFVFIINQGKELLLEHFDDAPRLKDVLELRGKTRELKKVEMASLPDGQPLTTYQKHALGLGHAIWCARDLVGDEAFAVMLPDDVIRSSVPCLKQMVDFYAAHGGNVLASMMVADDQVSKYGILKPRDVKTNFCTIDSVVEKPVLGTAPSQYAIIGRYILQPEIFKHLDVMVQANMVGAGGEIQLTDAILKLLADQKAYGFFFEGERHDCGSELGFIKAQIAFGLERDHLKAELVDYMRAALLKHSS